jgi:hypothetical protein|tara:strand:+ start:659 stop:1153 length:495 start_codon:yes stop_codon:yes gene_type:complete
MEYRVRSSGELISQGEARKRNPNVSLPKVWNDNVYDTLGIDPVFTTPKPDASGAYKIVVRDGVEQDSGSNWVEKWVEQDMFADTTVDGVTTTKAEHEAAYQAQVDADESASVRRKRDNLLSETDWMGMSDVTMSAGWTTYRQALRDIPAQSGFPHTVTWPTEPE